MNSEQLRKAYHKVICQQILGYRAGVPNIADKSSRRSIELAEGILARMGYSPCSEPPTGQRTGALFESLTCDYLAQAFGLIEHLRPGNWVFSVLENAPVFHHYEYLTDLAQVLAQTPGLRATLGTI